MLPLVVTLMGIMWLLAALGTGALVVVSALSTDACVRARRRRTIDRRASASREELQAELEAARREAFSDTNCPDCGSGAGYPGTHESTCPRNPLAIAERLEKASARLEKVMERLERGT